MKNCLLIVVLFGFLCSCQTTVKLSEINLPVGVVAMFRTCQIRQGSVRLTVRDDQEHLGDIDLEWLLDGTQKYTYQLYEPLGRTLLTAEHFHPKSAFKFSGLLAEKMPNVDTDSDGFLVVNHHLVGMKYQEIPCFLSFSLPIEWLNNVVRYNVDNKNMKIKIADGTRIIIVHVKNIGDKDKREVCVKTQWRSLWGILKHDYDMCFTNEGGYQAKMTGIGKYTIEWNNTGE